MVGRQSCSMSSTPFSALPRTGRIRNEEMRRLINAGHDRNEKLARKMGKKVKRFQAVHPDGAGREDGH